MTIVRFPTGHNEWVDGTQQALTPDRPDPTPAARFGLAQRGRRRLGVEARDARDRLIASDPGGTRLRAGTRAVVAVATTLAVEYGLNTALGVAPLLGTMMGAIIAMMLSTSVRENHRRRIVQTALGAPLAAGLGAAVATGIAPWHLPSLVAFVLITFVAVWVRRFGPRWFTLGFLAWQAYFFALFLHPPVAALPVILLSIVVAVAWVTVLLLTVLWDDPAKRLRRTVSALRAQARAGVSAALDLLDDPDDETEVRRLRAQLVRLSEVALLFDGQLAEARALPSAVSPARLRRWVVEIEVGMDEIVNVCLRLADRGPSLDGPRRQVARAALEALAWGELSVSRTRVAALAEVAGDDRLLHRLARSADYLLHTFEQWNSGEILTATSDPAAREPATGSDEAREAADALSGFQPTAFEPVITLMNGNLPGTTPSATRAVVDEDAAWWSPSGLRFTTRQAIQASVAAALAIVAGELISPQRYYWAVITAFVVFTGTATVGETIRKSVGRIAGTAIGLVAAVLLANATAQVPVLPFVIILACVFVAFYFAQLSQLVMIFCITVMLGQLYGLLHTFSDGLLVLRLEETAAGGIAGALTAVIVLPNSSRTALRQARKDLLTTLAELLAECADRLSGADRDRNLMAAAISLDAASRQVVKTAAGMFRGRAYGAGRAGLRHRLAVLGAAAGLGRVIASTVVITPVRDPALAQACADLSAECLRLAAIPELDAPPAQPDEGDDIGTRVGTTLDGADLSDELEPLAVQIRRLADTLAVLVPRGRRL